MVATSELSTHKPKFVYRGDYRTHNNKSPVSYTHLDVYKRQAQIPSLHLSSNKDVSRSPCPTKNNGISHKEYSHTCIFINLCSAQIEILTLSHHHTINDVKLCVLNEQKKVYIDDGVSFVSNFFSYTLYAL